ncbi:hypothetical protein KP509_23G057100 [Ceratopteris richardii]|uniref:O-fucosyltransferase family protein n=1 Tax=Ceratopteris richardii TaxID=49495 RepID=A0A8T2S026_CERRI|nr:hypothetical protein KP509_23G057100 [Ceratopteris richardii]
MKNPKQQTQEVLLPVRAFSRLSSGQHLGNTSPPASPRISSPRLRSASRTRSGRIQQWQSHGPSLQVQLHHHQLHQQRSRDLVHTCRKLLQRFAAFILSVLLRRRGVFLLAPLFYISGMLFYMSYIPMDVPVVSNTLPPGSSYRSPELFRLLWPKMQNSTSFFKLTDAWQKMKDGGKWRPCPDNLVSSKGLQNSSGFIIIEANGGLNQQRSSICNAVALAGILNATLVVPSFHFNSVWQDPSVFGEIYDEDYFIESLVGTVRVVKSLPDYVLASFGNNRSLIPNIKVKAWAPASFYTDTVLPKLLEKGAIRIAPFANRLSFEKIPLEFQKLRCFANFKALRFAQPIAATGRRLVELMRARSVNNDGKYVAVHLRFEEDMVAFSCCVYDGGEEEKLQLDAARERGWRGKFNRPGRVNDPAAFRRDGKCPLTPLEVGMMLRGIGFRNDTPIYLAAGKIYKADESMAPLREMFPWLQTKETLLSLEELEPFTKFSSRLAALDYTVCLHSEVFVTTQGGNFPQFLMGHRRYLYNGHSKTLKPDKRKLAVLFDNPELRWETFTEHMRSMWRHSDSKGRELRKASASIYTYPVPECMCSKESGESVSSAQQKTINVSSTTEDYF